jgi:Tol biopolymer transport system component
MMALEGRLVAHSETDRGLQLFVMDEPGQDWRQITSVDGDAINPEWSPDGERIVFQIRVDEECSIAFVDADGANLTILGRERGACEDQPTYMPDGKRIVFGGVEPDGTDAGLWSMLLDGSDRRFIGAGFGLAFGPRVSPDGTSVSAVGWNLVEDDGHHEGLSVMGIDGSSPRWVTPNWAMFPEHDWSTDGSWIVVSDHIAHEMGPANIALVRADGMSAAVPTFLTRYARADQVAGGPLFSPDGTWILYVLREHDRWGLFVTRPDGSDARQLTPFSGFFPGNVDWAPADDG